MRPGLPPKDSAPDAPAPQDILPPPSASKTRAPARAIWLTLALVLSVIEGMFWAAGAGLIGSPLWRPLAWQFGGFWAGLLYGWEPNYPAQPWVMFFSYGFLHAGWQHFLGNLVTLAWLGRLLEREISARRLAWIWLASMMGGALVFGLITTSPRPMVGASGAVMGLFAAWIVSDARSMASDTQPRRAIATMVLMRTGLVIALNLAIYLLQAGGLAWETHLGGFICGGLATLLPSAGNRADALRSGDHPPED